MRSCCHQSCSPGQKYRHMNLFTICFNVTIHVFIVEIMAACCNSFLTHCGSLSSNVFHLWSSASLGIHWAQSLPIMFEDQGLAQLHGSPPRNAACDWSKTFLKIAVKKYHTGCNWRQEHEEKDNNEISTNYIRTSTEPVYLIGINDLFP